MNHAVLLDALSSDAEGSVVHRLLKVFDAEKDVTAVKQTKEFKDTVQHSLLDAFIEGDSEFRQQIRKPIRQMYETSVSNACIRALTAVPEPSAHDDFMAHLISLESILRSYYIFKYVA